MWPEPLRNAKASKARSERGVVQGQRRPTAGPPQTAANVPPEEGGPTGQVGALQQDTRGLLVTNGFYNFERKKHF